MTYAIQVTWKGGKQEYLLRGICANGPIALFPSIESAERERDFIIDGLEQEEYESVNVVKYEQQYEPISSK